jgi:hypothetical protein
MPLMISGLGGSGSSVCSGALLTGPTWTHTTSKSLIQPRPTHVSIRAGWAVHIVRSCYLKHAFDPTLPLAGSFNREANPSRLQQSATVGKLRLCSCTVNRQDRVDWDMEPGGKH